MIRDFSPVFVLAHFTAKTVMPFPFSDDDMVTSVPEKDELDIKKPSTVSLLAVVIVLLFMALTATVIYFLCIRPRHADISSQLTRLSSVSQEKIKD